MSDNPGGGSFLSPPQMQCTHWLTGKAVGIPEMYDLRCAREAGHPANGRESHMCGSETWNNAAGEWRTAEATLAAIWATAGQPRSAHTTCAWPGCTRSPDGGHVLVRVNPKGEPGIWMCLDDARVYTERTDRG